ncbi:AfsA-related hotdog domain-containing protein [Glycomyces sp. NPDC049804]|uniref:AfsA-related hotdog domain-containing protein n=1 Tax=Glycomyces sp. NPDC049804 TaxID=3154363 RepID=UPI003434B3AA
MNAAHERSVMVVGDRFEEFLTHPGTIGVSAMLEFLRIGAGDGPPKITVGQGLTGEQLAELDKFAETGRCVLSTQDHVPQPVERAVTHKVYEKNVLIGDLERVGEGRYRTPLVLDERVEVLEDHLTGLHIPAVTLLEAARQTWTAVTERYLIEPEPKSRFVISHVNSTFLNFVFPIPAQLEYRLRSKEKGPVGHVIAFTVEIQQTGRIAARFEAEIRVIPERFAEKQEAMAARQTLRDETTPRVPTGV